MILETEKTCLVVIDMQNDFVTGALKNDRAIAIVNNVVKTIKRAKELNYDIFYTLDTHGYDYDYTQEGKKLPIKHCIQNTDGWKLIPEVRCLVDPETDIIIKKPTFGSIELAELLKKYKNIYLIGVCTDICVVSNALIIKAYNMNSSVAVVRNATAGLTAETEEAAVLTMETCQVNIIPDSTKLPEPRELTAISLCEGIQYEAR